MTTRGNCFCKKTTWEFEGDMTWGCYCHCDDCRKASGAAYLTNLFVKAEGLTIEGERMEFKHKADSGSDMTKVNCAKCGSPVYGLNSSREGIVVIRAGSLDQKELVKPGVNLFVPHKIPSTPLDEDLKTFDGMPG